MLRDFVGDFVTFQHVLEAADLDAEAFHQADEHEDFVLAIAVAMNPAPALEDFADGFEFEVAPGRERGQARRLLLLWPGIPGRR